MATWTKWYGFTRSTIAHAPESAGVYEIAFDGCRTHYPDGFSSTIYYGKADGSIASRLSYHYRGRGNLLIKQLLDEDEYLKVRWWRTFDDPRAVECRLINRFYDQFGARPLGNQRGCRR